MLLFSPLNSIFINALGAIVLGEVPACISPTFTLNNPSSWGAIA